MDLTYIRKLDEQVSSEEIKKALFDMKPWKAPDSNGFLAGCYRRSWDVV